MKILATAAGKAVGFAVRRGRAVVTTAIELAGFACIAYGAFLIIPAAGWIVGGALAVAFGFLEGRPS